MKIGIYGGTFNPIHTGHIHAAKQAADILNLDKLLMIPDRIAPHKEIPSGSPTPEQRLEMLQLAVANEPGIVVSDMELKREGPSYTYLTVEALRAEYPDCVYCRSLRASHGSLGRRRAPYRYGKRF